MSVAHNNAGAKYRQSREANTAHGIFLHAHHSNITKPAASCAACRGKQAELGDSAVMAASRKRSHDADLKSLQFFFAPACRSGTDTHTAHGADRTSAQNFTGKRSSALGKVSGAGIKYDVAYP